MMKRAMLSLGILLLALATARGDDPLGAGFKNPPDSAKPHTWWHWMNGNVTKEGISADLEAMKRVGIGGAQIFVADCDIPAGPVRFMTPEFREMVKHAAAEADRLGIGLCLHNCAGWSSSGGPWMTPDHAMQFVTTSEVKVKGPSKFSDTLPQPPTKLDYYKDVAVLAFPTPAGELKSFRELNPKITTSRANTAVENLIDGKSETEITFPRPAANQNPFVQIDFDQPTEIRSISVTPGRGIADAEGVIEASDDGESFREIRPFVIPRRSTLATTIALGAPVSSKIFRLRFDRAGPGVRQIALAEISLSGAPVVENLQIKAGFLPNPVDQMSADRAAGQAIDAEKIVELTSKLSSDGKLDWDVPEGNWTILRIGHTPTGKTNHPAPPEATGPECDKFSREALDAHWAGYVQKIIDDIGPLAGKALNNALIDSYEVGGQNWTPKMREEFEKRRGYDPTRFLPALTGRVVESPEISDRFLWDFRRTIADLFADNYFGYFAELCHKHGMKASIEPYTGPFESLQVGKHADIVMGEFWTGANWGDKTIKLAASVAHIYGKPIVGAESFTAEPGAHGRWQEDPYSLKALGDKMYCWGINRYIFHRYAMQPWLDRFPGMTMGQWGFHNDRTNTWFEQSTAWLKYVARCQYLLQQGIFAADAAYFCGENAPVEVKVGDPPLPPGYDFDAINADALLTRASVKDGRIALADATSYAVLVLPPKLDVITPALAQKIRQLVSDGATIVGPKPKRSPSLQDYPRCDEDVRLALDDVWGDCDGAGVTEHAFGKGKVVWNKSLATVFADRKLPPDFELAEGSRAKLAYIHRIVGDKDVYFVSNQRDGYAQADCVFRVAGKRPQLWHADSGLIEPAPVWSEAGGRTTVSLQFDPAGSVFVVFEPGGASNHLVAFQPPQASPTTKPTLIIRSAFYEAVEGNGSRDVTDELKAMVQSGMNSFEVRNATFGGDPAPDRTKQLRVEFSIDGKAQQKITKEPEKFELLVMEDARNAPACELTASNHGKIELLAWQAGEYDVKKSDGSTNHLHVEQAAAPLEIDGPWEVRFPPNWGAPENISLDKLASWTANSDDGVKYFSGTATYLKKLDVSSDMIATDRSLFLDLGRVKNLAQVKLNGQDLGILWKPPFRVDLTAAAKPGTNALEIQITNLWPNRLIGDERIGESDSQWSGKKLARMPQWLLEKKPSPSGRLTFTTWRHWTKDMEPLESGLLGPVIVQSVRRVAVQ